jgi:hypothetical protein
MRPTRFAVYGGRMWMEEKIGKRINHERVEETLRTQAPRVETACPFCLTIFRDGICAKGAERRNSRCRIFPSTWPRQWTGVIRAPESRFRHQLSLTCDSSMGHQAPR